MNYDQGKAAITGGPDPASEWPDLYRRIGYDPIFEVQAFSRLISVDPAGCREAFARLVQKLDFAALGTHGRSAVLLLLHLLLQVNARVNRASSDGRSYHSNRVALFDRFAAYDDPEDARTAFLPALNRLLAPLDRSASGSHSALVERARAYVEGNYHRRISLSAVARDLHVSPHYLSRLFHQETGTTLTASIHRARLEHARVLLAAKDRSLSEIAYLVGYQNYRDFYRNFRKFEKASPRQVQRKLVSEHQGRREG
jgi:two-component system response regulator YesN